MCCAGKRDSAASRASERRPIAVVNGTAHPGSTVHGAKHRKETTGPANRQGTGYGNRMTSPSVVREANLFICVSPMARICLVETALLGTVAGDRSSPYYAPLADTGKEVHASSEPNNRPHLSTGRSAIRCGKGLIENLELYREGGKIEFNGLDPQLREVTLPRRTHGGQHTWRASTGSKATCTH